jgi:hypothetical protein
MLISLSLLVVATAIVVFLAGRRESYGPARAQELESRGIPFGQSEYLDKLNNAETAGGGERAQVIADEPAKGSEVQPPKEGPELWELHYRWATLGQLIDERRALEEIVFEESEAYFENAWEAGWYEYVEQLEGHLEKGHVRFPRKVGVIAQFEVDSETKLVRRATLPRNGHESTYLAYDKACWLLGREHQLRASDGHDE